MEITLTLCDKTNKKNIPQHNLKDKEALELLAHWITGKKFNESVFVCFKSLRGLPMGLLRNEQSSFLVSHDPLSISTFCEMWIEADDSIVTLNDSKLVNVDYNHIDFTVFEFESYEEAFKFCIDIKEGF